MDFITRWLLCVVGVCLEVGVVVFGIWLAVQLGIIS